MSPKPPHCPRGVAVRAGPTQITASVEVATDIGFQPADSVMVTAIEAQAAGSTAYSGAVDLADGSVTLPAATDISTSCLAHRNLWRKAA